MASAAEAAAALLDAVQDPLAEPAYALLALIAGKRRPRDDPGPPASQLCSPGGFCIDLGRPGLRAWLPLRSLPADYRSPLRVTASLLSRAIQAVADAGKPPLIVDYTARRAGRICRPRLGCRPWQGGYQEAPRRVSPPSLRPRLCLPGTLYPRCIRIARPRRFEAEAVLISSPDTCLEILCLDNGCIMEATAEEIHVIEGEAALRRIPRCGSTRLYIDTLLESAYSYIGEAPEIVSPSLWIMGHALPLWAARANSQMEILLWNPGPRPHLATLITRSLRITEASVATPGHGIEKLAPEMDRVRVPLPGYGAVLLRLRTRRLPPLLTRR